MQPVLSLVLPTLNESKSLPLLVPRISSALHAIPHEILVVDDDSPDETWKIGEKLAEKYSLRVIRRQNERGLSSAVVRGITEASGEFVCVMDSDGSHPPEIIPQMVQLLENGKIDACIASRYMQGGEVEDWPFFRKVISIGATYLARPLTRVSDPMSGFFCLKRSLIQTEKIHPIGYKILLEILVKNKIQRVGEIPYTFVNRKVGRSNLSWKQYREYVQHVMELYLWQLTQGHHS